MSYDRFDVVLVLFPFTERRGSKKRPAIVLSDSRFAKAHAHSIVAMVTTASLTKWPSDLAIQDVGGAGLHAASVGRAKLFTISHDLIIGKVGALTPADANAFAAWAGSLIGR